MGARGSGGEADGMRILRYGAATAAALAITTATSAVPGPARAAGAATVSWHACEGTGLDPRQECATLRVPLDYRRPDGPRIELAISRIPSERPEKRRGVLLLIPGGPGNPGLDRPSAVDDELPAAVREAYDIVGFDPRGVGHSTPISCDLSREDLAPANQRPWPAPDGDISGNVTTERRIARTCAQRGGDLIRNISTVNEARDIDRIRRALGEAKISAWGVSYGTYVGAVYTAVFPQHTDRVVLDSNDDPDPVRVERAWLANYAVGVEDRFPDFATWASKADNPYRLAANPGAVRSLFTALAARLDREPIPWPGADPPRLSGNVLRETLLDDLYDDDDFPSLATLIRAARDSRPLPEPSSPPDAVLQNTTAVAVGTLCNDVTWPDSIPDIARDVAADRVRHPLTAGMPANVMPCAFWPYRPADPPTRVTSHGPSNVLLVQNLRDPATPYSGALNMRRAFGDRARMVTVDSGGHEAYLANGNACGDRLVTAFLAEGRRPAHDTVCPAR
jgi:pimeloyl-ACP methyl ester carboxylesterase